MEKIAGICKVEIMEIILKGVVTYLVVRIWGENF
jgi:hypothetical protein